MHSNQKMHFNWKMHNLKPDALASRTRIESAAPVGKTSNPFDSCMKIELAMLTDDRLAGMRPT